LEVMKTISNDKNGNSNGKSIPLQDRREAVLWLNLDLVESKLISLLRELVNHSGFGELKVHVRILKDGRKEVILSFGKEYRFVLTRANNGITEKLKN